MRLTVAGVGHVVDLKRDETVEETSTPHGTPDGGRRSRLAPLRDSRALAAWQSHAFQRFFWANAASMGGRQLQTTAIGYIVYELSGSNFLLGLVSFMQMVPQLILAPLVGVLVDRFDRRRIMAAQLTVQGLGLLALAVLALVDLLSVPAIAGAVVVMGMANAFSYPANSSLMPSILPLGAIQSANALRSLMGNVMGIAAPALAGFVIDGAGIGTALLIGAGFYFPAALLFLTVPIIFSAVAVAGQRGTLEQGQASGARGFAHDIADAMRYIRSEPLVRAALANDIVPYLFGLSYVALLPALARDTLHGGAQTLGLLFSATAAGSLFGTLTAGALTGRGHRGRTIWIGMLGYGLSLLIVAAGSTRAVILPGLALTGYFQMLYIIQNDTLVQTLSSDRYRGRTVAAQSMVNGLMPFGFLLLGTIAQLTSVAAAFAVSGVALATGGVYTALFRHTMRQLR
jgi:MFS family permease